MSPESRRALAQQALSFLAVGGIGFIVDFSVFNVLRTTALAHDPIAAKVISTTLAIVANWIGNRYWTFRSQRRRGTRVQVVREAVEFALVSAAGSLIALGCLWVSHYELGLTSVLDDNLATNVVGLALGTAFRFVLYRVWVFGSGRTRFGSGRTRFGSGRTRFGSGRTRFGSRNIRQDETLHTPQIVLSSAPSS